MICIKQNGGQITNFVERKTCVYVEVLNLGFPESKTLAEVGNKAF